MLYVSDIHLRNGRSDRLCTQVLDAVAGWNPDVVLLGGDLVDSSSELGRLRDLVGRLREIASVLAIGGNHDQRIGMDRYGRQSSMAAANGSMTPRRESRMAGG